MLFRFESRADVCGFIPAIVEREHIHEEPLLFGASSEFAFACGGPLTRSFLKQAETPLQTMRDWCGARGMHVVIDTRSHMLMPGFYPAIPGWHCDAYPRAGYGEQPDLERGDPEAHHLVAFCSDQRDGVSRTLFQKPGTAITIEVDRARVWASVHAKFGGSVEPQRDGEILRFYQSTLHCAQPAHAKGWRWWVRASCFYKPPENTIRRQVQVYAPEGLGW